MILFLNQQQMFVSEVYFRVAARLQNKSIRMISNMKTLGINTSGALKSQQL